jgi:DNA-binding response OmpR family regulator
MKRILCVDDEIAMLQCLKTALEADGYETICISQSEEVLATMHEEDVDLVLLDVRMPGLSGIDVYNELRKDNPVPVLFVTAFHRSFNMDSEPMLQMWQDEFAKGTTDILYKPFDIAELREKIRALIGDPTNE